MKDGNKTYVIWAPSYAENSAGNRCLYLLCDHLNRLGYRSQIIKSAKTPKTLNAPLTTPKRVEKDLKSGRAVMIYPEVVSGNPLGAKHVVRWVLNQPGLLGGGRLFHPDEKVFSYSRVYLHSINNPVKGILYLPTIDRALFYPPEANTERNTIAFYVGKSSYKAGYFDPKAATEITRTYPDSRVKLADLLRRCRLLYCFDNSTILVYEAAMCGCPVVIIPDGTHSSWEYEQLELGTFGISWGPENLEQTLRGIDELPRQYDKVVADFGENLDLFIQHTQSWDDVPQKIPTALLQRYTDLEARSDALYYSWGYELLQRIEQSATGRMLKTAASTLSHGGIMPITAERMGSARMAFAPDTAILAHLDEQAEELRRFKRSLQGKFVGLINRLYRFSA